jgi:hypothetical protein
MIDPDCVDDFSCALKRWDLMGRVSIDDDVICELDVVDYLTSIILFSQSSFGRQTYINGSYQFC